MSIRKTLTDFCPDGSKATGCATQATARAIAFRRRQFAIPLVRYGMPIGAALLLTISACNRKLGADKLPGAAEVEVQTRNSSVSTTATNKLDRCIKCFNAAMRINGATQAYFAQVQHQLPRLSHLPGRVAKADPNTHSLCQQAAHDKSQLLVEFDSILPRYTELARILVLTLEQMDKYYREKQYEKDNLTLAHKYHNTVTSTLAEFEPLHEQIADAIDKQAETRDDIALEAECCDPSNLRYGALVFLRDSRRLSHEIARTNHDKSRILELRHAVLLSHDQMVQCANDNPTQVDDTFMFLPFRVRSQHFANAVRQANVRTLTNASVDNILATYNLLVDASNLLRWKYKPPLGTDSTSHEPR